MRTDRFGEHLHNQVTTINTTIIYVRKINRNKWQTSEYSCAYVAGLRCSRLTDTRVAENQISRVRNSVSSWKQDESRFSPSGDRAVATGRLEEKGRRKRVEHRTSGRHRPS